MTSAPMSAMIWVQYGPITIAVRSTTRTPASGPALAMPHPAGHLEAVAQMVGVAVGHDGKHQWRVGIPDGIQLFGHLLDRPRRAVHARCFGDNCSRHPAG